MISADPYNSVILWGQHYAQCKMRKLRPRAINYFVANRELKTSPGPLPAMTDAKTCFFQNHGAFFCWSHLATNSILNGGVYCALALGH